jgi:hypothetical protein
VIPSIIERVTKLNANGLVGGLPISVVLMNFSFSNFLKHNIQSFRSNFVMSHSIIERATKLDSDNRFQLKPHP